MKWKRKLHEFDYEAEQYRNQGFLMKEIFIFGAGVRGKNFSNLVRRFCNLAGFLDNDEEKQGKMCCGVPVMSVQKFVEDTRDSNCLVVLCLKDECCCEVKQQLMMENLTENETFMTDEEYEHRLQISLFYERRILYLPIAQISLTERCTLRCKKCAHACHLVSPKQKDLTLEEAKESADYFFKFVDYGYEFVLIGGEPFLYKDLLQIVQYIGENYRDKMEIFSITTNGTILPSENILEICKKYHVLLRISNYVAALPRLKKQYELLTQKLASHDIPYTIGNAESQWMDYGFDYLDREGSEEDLEKVFDACRTECHEIRRNRFYFCVMARSVAENMGKNVGTEDFLDLDMLDPADSKGIFFEYMMGYSDKGYLDMCNYCYGAEAKEHPISVAEQCG